MIFSKRKRLLVFNDSLSLGGTEKLLVNLLNHLVDKKCDVTLILPEETEDNVLLSAVSEEVNLIYLYSSSDSSFVKRQGEIKMIFMTSSFLRKKEIFESDYDEVVCFKEGFYAKMFSSWKIPKTLWLHNIFYHREYEINSLRERIAIWLNKKKIAKTYKSYESYNRVVAVSSACKQSYLNVVFDGRLPIQDIRVVSNAIDQQKVRDLSQESIPEVMNSEKTKFVLLTRLSPDKRLDRIISASSKLVQEGYEFEVHILGSKTDDRSVKEIVEKSNLQKTVFLYGAVVNPYPYVKQSNWLICVSERESFSLVLLEAMALGTPVVTTDCGGPAEIVERGKFGLLVENTTEGVYKGMKSVLDDKSLEEKYSFSLDKNLERYNLKSWFKTVDKLLSL